MVKVIKSISLDEQTAPIASAKDNFSAWVREQLLAEIAHTFPCRFMKKPVKVYDNGKGYGPYQIEDLEEICNGLRKPPCPSCYPEGPPDREMWKSYMVGQMNKEELQAACLEKWKWRTDLKKQRKERNVGSENDLNGSNTPPLKPQRAYVRRGLTWVWSWIW